MKSVSLFLLSFALVFKVQASAQENVISCTEAGDQTHRLLKTEAGYRIHVNFSMHLISPKYNLETNSVEGQGYIGIDVPLENESVRMTSVNWINEKAKFFNELFPKTALPTEDSVRVGELILDVEEGDCFVKEVDGFIFANCRARGPHKINGVEIKNIDFSMQNQVRRTLVNDAKDSHNIVLSEVDAIYANLSFHKVRGYGTYIYRSSMTYYPNNEEIQCSIGKH